MRVTGGIPGGSLPIEGPEDARTEAAAPGAEAAAPAARSAAAGTSALPSRMDVQRGLLERASAAGAVGAAGGPSAAGGVAGAGEDHAALRAVFDKVGGPSAVSSTYRMDRNVDAFASRWKTIEGATRTFDTTYFIWEKDVFGYAYLGHMLKKQKEGVQVRGMIDATGDAIGVKGFKATFRGQDYLQELVEHGAQFGVFNPVLKKDFSSLKGIIASNHDKLAIADGKVVETGGRNMAAHYFSDPKDHKGVYRDTDIHIESPVVARSATEAFAAEFENEKITDLIEPDALGNWSKKDIELLGAYEMMDHWLKAPPLSDAEKDAIRAGGGEKYVDEVMAHVLKSLPSLGIDREPSSSDLSMLRELATELVSNPELRGASAFDPQRFEGEVKIIDSVSASSTGPVAISDAAVELIGAAEKSIYIHNPYIVLTERGLQALEEAGKRGVEIVFGTNSPESTDSAATQAFFQEDWPMILARVPNARILVATGEQKHHSKSFVIDGVLTGVSTYNADWISARVNSEVVALEWSKDFADDTVKSYERDLADPAHGAVEYTILRDAEGKAVLVDGRPVVTFGPEDHMDKEALNDKYETLRKAANWARENVGGLAPLKHRPLSEATDNVREMDWKASDADLRELAASPGGRRALEGKIDELESGWTNDAEAAQITRVRAEVTKSASVSERQDVIRALLDGFTNDREEEQVKHILVSANPADLNAILDKVPAEKLADELETDQLAAVLASLARGAATGQGAHHLAALLGEVDDDVTLGMLERAKDLDLRGVARAPKGREALSQAFENLDSGWTTSAEEKGMKRLKAAIG